MDDARSVPQADLLAARGLDAAAAALRALQDAFAAAAAPEDLLDEIAATLRDAAARLAPHRVAEQDRVVGRRDDLIGHGQTLVPPVQIVESGTDHVRGRTVCGDHFHGSAGIAHGGLPPLLLDDVLGRFANVGGRPPTKTAFLNVQYRAPLHIGREIEVRCRVAREEGRKRWLAGDLLEDGEVVASAEGLFIALRPRTY